MLTLQFKDFFKGDYEEYIGNERYELYMIYESHKCLYIGISNSNIWNRWFATRQSHCQMNIHNELFGKSSIGQYIADLYPDFKNITITLLTVKQASEFFPQNDNIQTRQDLEPRLIQRFNPIKNRIYNHNIK